MFESEGDALIALNLTGMVGNVVYRRLRARAGSAGRVFLLSPRELAGVKGVRPKLVGRLRQSDLPEQVAEEKARAGEAGVRIITLEDDEYPGLLAGIFDPPLVLYLKGEFRSSDALAVAMVGARRSSHYGQKQARRLAGALALAGFTVVSGLARGIDAAAHEGALEAGGRTLAVIGCGLSQMYPQEHAELADRVAARGAVLSELPMGFPVLAENFPRRNRIISGLSLGVVVVEAATRSGSLISARWALEQGREVFAVPGPVDRPSFRGCHRLIREGAKLVETAEDILEELGPLERAVTTPEGVEVQDPRLLALSEEEQRVLSAVDSEPRDVDDVIRRAELPTSTVSAALFSLELKRLVVQLSGKQFVRS